MSRSLIQIELENGITIKHQVGITPQKLLIEHPELENPAAPVMGVLINNELMTLDYPIETDCHLKYVTFRDSHGQHIYRHSITLLLAKAVNNLYPKASFAVEHSLSLGLYCSFDQDGGPPLEPDFVKKLETEMRSIAELALPIRRKKISYQEACDYFDSRGLTDKLNLLRYRNPSRVAVYECGKFMDLAHVPIATDTAKLSCFKLEPHETGFVIRFPKPSDMCDYPPFDPAPHLFQIFKEHKLWGRAVRVRTVGDLNNIIARHGIKEFIQVCEAFQEKRIVRVADAIARKRKHLKWIMIAGPSSSGKTTFARRLAIQLQANGIRTQAISMDDYFVNREQTPHTSNGSHDFEHIDAVDLALMHQHMKLLEKGEQVELPSFNFQSGRREFTGKTAKVEKDSILIIEGIHGLNPRSSEALPRSHIFKIYVSALMQLNLDRNNRISTTDNRLIRRMIRDNFTRGHTCLDTLDMWHKVRSGENHWIFPYQQEADIAFNTALEYELAVLKPFAEPLLAQAKPCHHQYAEARRLQDFLSNFLVASHDEVPSSSLLREFIGGSTFTE
ncbi:nucleoside kinase [Verrucomicrobiota bacterium]